MKVLKANYVLATAAIMAALAASSCGSGSLNPGSETDIDLATSTTVPATEERAGAFAELDLENPGPEPLEGLDEIEDPWAWDLKHIEMQGGWNTIENDEYLESRHAHEYEAANGHALNLEGDWVPIMDSFTSIYDITDLSFVTYGLKGLEENKKVAGFVTLHGQGEFIPGKGFYIGFSNFETGHWVFKGPFTKFDHMYQITMDNSVNAEGYSYISLIVDPNVGLEIDELDVYVGNPNV
jgi:hypothetical protein